MRGGAALLPILERRLHFRRRLSRRNGAYRRGRTLLAGEWNSRRMTGNNRASTDMTLRRDIIRRFNVHRQGRGERVVVLAHGFGCDQHVWARLAAELVPDFRVVLFDHVGSGRTDIAAYDPRRYGSLQGYADDVVEMLEGLDLKGVTFVGHSVSSMIGMLAAIARPALFERLVMIAPSARYLDDVGYRGGWSPGQLADLFKLMETQPAQWARTLSELAVDPDHPASRRELEHLFSMTRPSIVRHFAEVTLRADCRGSLGLCTTPTLILECRDDPVAPEGVAAFVADHLQAATLVRLSGRGHCPHLTAAAELAARIRQFAMAPPSSPGVATPGTTGTAVQTARARPGPHRA